MKRYVLPLMGVVITALFTACNTPDAPKPQIVFGASDIAGTEWNVESIDGALVAGGSKLSLRFETEERISGDSGVNTFGGGASFEAGTIQVGALAVTRRAGPPALMEQEQKFFQALNRTTQYRWDAAGLLRMADADGKPTLQLSPLPKR